MEEIVFVTHNKGKIESAKKDLKEVNFKVYEYELEEPRSDDINYISKYKVMEAYKLVNISRLWILDRRIRRISKSICKFCIRNNKT